MPPVSSLLYGGSAAFFTLAAILHILYLVRREFAVVARWSTRIAWAFQSVSLIYLVSQTRQPPVHTLFEFAFFFVWLMMSNYVAVELYTNNQSAGAFLMPALAVVDVVSIAMPKPKPEALFYEFPMSLVGWHIGVTMLGYAFLTASFVAGGLYLLQENNLRRKRWGPLYQRLPSLETLDIWSGRFVYVGFPLFTIGTLAGITFAHVSWSRFWEADAKVLFTVFVWIMYTVYLLLRNVWGWGGRKAAWLSVVGVLSLLINYFVVNLLSGLHRFGV